MIILFMTYRFSNFYTNNSNFLAGVVSKISAMKMPFVNVIIEIIIIKKSVFAENMIEKRLKNYFLRHIYIPIPHKHFILKDTRIFQIQVFFAKNKYILRSFSLFVSGKLGYPRASKILISLARWAS